MYKILYIFLVFNISACHAGIYKWVDGNGVVHFSDQSSVNSEAAIKVEDVKENSGSTFSHQNTQKSNENNISNMYFKDILDKANEMKNDAEECNYIAINKKELDVSCKNYITLLKRDIGPLIEKLTEHIRSAKSGLSKEDLEKNYQILRGIAEEADGKYSAAISLLLNELINIVDQMNEEVDTCYQNAVYNGFMDESCRKYLENIGQRYTPLVDKFKEYLNENDQIQEKINKVELISKQLEVKFKNALTIIHSKQQQ